MPNGVTDLLSPARWYRAPNARVRQWAAAQAGAGWRVERVHRLRGGIAAAVDGLVLRAPAGSMSRLVLKRWTRPGWAEEDPEFTPAREAAVLAALAATRIPAPRLVAVDPDGDVAGVPALLMTHLDGRRPSAADEGRSARILAMAEQLAAIHDVRGPLFEIVDPFRPWYELEQIVIPPASRRPDLWQAAFALAAAPPRAEPPSFLHRDYHPANTLWQGPRLTGVVDWVGASTGPIAVDLAHWRTNLGTRHGATTADRVLDASRAITGRLPADQPWWDVRMLLDYLDAPEDLTAADLEPYETYLQALLARV